MQDRPLFNSEFLPSLLLALTVVSAPTVGRGQPAGQAEPAPKNAADHEAVQGANPIAVDETADSQAVDEGSTPRPSYDVLRYREDWSVLADESLPSESDLFDPIKYVPLTDDGSIWASFGGQARVRAEGFSNFGFAPDNDDVYVLGRARLHGDLHLGENFRVFVEGKSAHATERDLPGGRRTLDVDSLDLLNAFGEATAPLGDDTSLSLRVGRQELLFGAQRLISPLDWSNTRRTFDGGRATLELTDWTIDAFYTSVVDIEKYDFNEPDEGSGFFGIYGSGEIPGAPVGLDLYYLGLDQDAAAINGTAGDGTRHTLGARVFGDVGETGLDYDLEAAYQFGELGDGDVSAFMLAGEAGYAFADSELTPRIWLGAGYASGDDEPGGDVGAFNQLYPLGHAYLGYIDAIGRQNVAHLNPGVSIKPIDRLTLQLQGHYFLRASTDDAVYNAGGGVLRSGGGSDSRDVGTEIDLLAKYAVDRHFVVLGGYSRLFPGQFIEDTGPGEPIDFGYVSLQYTF